MPETVTFVTPDDIETMKIRIGIAELRIAALEAATPPPTELERFLNRPQPAPSNFKLVGGWRVPNAVGGQATGFTGGGLAVRKNVDGTLTFWFGNISEVQTAGVMGVPGDPTKWPLLLDKGRVTTAYNPVKDWDANSDDPSPLGVEWDVYNNRLLLSGRSGYAAPVPNDPFFVAIDSGKDGAVSGPFGLVGGLCQVFGEDFIRVPKWFADAFLDGWDLGLAGGGYESGQGSTAGPSLAVVNRNALAAAMPFITLLRFGDFGTQNKALRERRPADYTTPPWSPSVDGLETPSPDDDIGYWAADQVCSGSVFVVDTPELSGLCYFTIQGTGPLAYSNQNETFCANGVLDAQKQRLYVYSWKDLKAVVESKIAPSDVRGTYYDWPLPLPSETMTWSPLKRGNLHRVQGATIQNGMLYVLHRWIWGGNSEWWPVIAAYNIVS